MHAFTVSHRHNYVHGCVSSSVFMLLLGLGCIFFRNSAASSTGSCGQKELFDTTEINCWVLPSLIVILMMSTGKPYQREQAIRHHRGEHLGVPGLRFERGSIFYNKLPISREDCTCMAKPSHFLDHLICPSAKSSLRPRVTFFGEMENTVPNSFGFNFCGHFKNIYLKRRVSRRCECFLSSDPCNGSCVQPTKLDKLGISDGQCQQPEYRLATRTRADFKSEPYDITGPPLDMMQPSWWRQFPKRWVIVLLCFSAFLLCNMDRVSYFLVFFLNFFC